MSNATMNFVTMNQPGDNKQQRTLYNQTTKDPADKSKDHTTTDQTTIEVCRTMTDKASMNDQSTKKLEDQMTRDMTAM